MEGGGGDGKTRIATVDHITALFSSKIQSFIPSPSSTLLLAEKRLLSHHLRSQLPAALRLIIRLIILLLSPFLSLLATIPPPPAAAADTPSARALDQVLFLVSRVPVASRKYELVRSLAERLLDENKLFSCGLEALNRPALSNAFSGTVRRLEAAVAAAGYGAGDRSLEMIVGAVRSGFRRWAGPGVEEEGVVVPADKLAAELLWLAERMAGCGAAWEAVARWGGASELGRLAISAEPRIQVALVRLSVFLFKHANKEYDEGEDDEECPVTHHRMAMLKSWLPLLCRASNGADAPILSSKDRAEMVRILEELIQKLSWDQQEEVLALWLYHFTCSPDSDWPNLESSYIQWYAESRKLLLK